MLGTKNDKGFLLVEIILAISILALIVVGIFSAILYGEKSQINSGKVREASKVASDSLDIIRSLRDEIFSATNPPNCLPSSPCGLEKGSSGVWSFLPNIFVFKNTLNFNGSDNYITVSNSDSFNFTNQVTVSAWVNVAAGHDGTYRPVIVTDPVFNPFQIYVGDCGPGEVFFTLNVGGNNIEHRCTDHISSNVWHLLTGTYDGSNVKFYIDGQVVENDSASGNLIVNMNDLLIGKGYDPGISAYHYFNGYINQPAIWNRALTSAEIQTLYNNGQGIIGKSNVAPFNNGLVAGYNLDQTSGSTVNDFSANGNIGTINNANWISLEQNNSAPFKTSLSFDGSTNYIDLGQKPASQFNNSSNGVTYSAWVNLAQLPASGNWMWAFSYEDSAPCEDLGIGYDNGVMGNGFFMAADSEGGCGSRHQFDSGVTGTPNQWYHLVGVIDYSNSIEYLYLNGSLIQSSAWTGTPISRDMNAHIGLLEPPSMDSWNGKLNQVAVWNRPLNSTEVQELYNNGAGISGNINTAPFNNGLVAGYNLTEGSGTTITDFSGYGNNGTLNGGATWANNVGDDNSGFHREVSITGSPDFANALSFDGNSGYVQTPITDLSGTDQLSISYWFKGSTLSSVVRQQPTPGDYIVAGWDNGDSNSNPIQILSFDDGTSNGLNIDSTGGTTVQNGNWHLVTMTWQRNTPNGFKSYLDGNLTAERNSADVAIPNLNSNVNIGRYNGAPREYLNGKLNQVAIWNRALSSAEIQTLYNSGKGISGNTSAAPFNTGLVAGYNLDEGTGGTVTDFSGHSNTGTINGATWVQNTDKDKREVTVNVWPNGLSSTPINLSTELYNTKLGACGITKSISYGGETYPVVPIGDQCWLGRNLDIGTRIDDGNSDPCVNLNPSGQPVMSCQISDNEKYCYNNNKDENNNDKDYCSIYGGLYEWAEAMNFPYQCNNADFSSGSSDCGTSQTYTITTQNQGICPTGWHLPSSNEWTTLINYLNVDGQGGAGTGAGAKLKEAGTTHWNQEDCGNSTCNSTNFSGLGGGTRNGENGGFDNEKTWGVFWSSSINTSSTLYSQPFSLYASGDGVGGYDYDRARGYSVRCVRN